MSKSRKIDDYKLIASLENYCQTRQAKWHDLPLNKKDNTVFRILIMQVFGTKAYSVLVALINERKPLNKIQADEFLKEIKTNQTPTQLSILISVSGFTQRGKDHLQMMGVKALEFEDAPHQLASCLEKAYQVIDERKAIFRCSNCNVRVTRPLVKLIDNNQLVFYRGEDLIQPGFYFEWMDDKDDRCDFTVNFNDTIDLIYRQGSFRRAGMSIYCKNGHLIGEADDEDHTWVAAFLADNLVSIYFEDSHKH